MSRVNKWDYQYPVCPHCHSKRIDDRQMSDPRVGCSEEQGYICFNCQRFFTESDEIFDRAEMRRDIKNLTAFLLGEKE